MLIIFCHVCVLSAVMVANTVAQVLIFFVVGLVAYVLIADVLQQSSSNGSLFLVFVLNVLGFNA